MPTTLDDTVDFNVATLNDLLDADVRTGVPVAADDKYKRWAFLSTGLAGMLLVGLILALVVGGGDGGGSATTSTEEFPRPPGTQSLSVNAGTADLEGIVPGTKVSIYGEDGTLLANGATVLKVTEKEADFLKGAVSRTVKVAVTGQEVSAVTGAQKVKLVEGEVPTTTTTAAPVSGAPIPIEPAPAAPPPS